MRPFIKWDFPETLFTSNIILYGVLILIFKSSQNNNVCVNLESDEI